MKHSYKPVIIFFCIMISPPFLSAQEKYIMDTTANKEYYTSGKLKSIQHQGYFNACGITVGTDSMFYSTGQLQQTILHDNRKDKKDESCHATWTTEISKTFFKNGKLKLSSQIKYQYESVSCNCGTWTWYNSRGVMIKRKKFNNCYDQKLPD